MADPDPLRIGIFGGSFDPIHLGHLVAATAAAHACELDRVLMMVANEPWQKVGTRAITAPEIRLAMVEAAVAGHPVLEASRLEIDRGGPSYMADTVAELGRQHEGAELFLIMGMDTAGRLDTWYRSAEIAEGAHLVVVNRPGEVPPTLGAQWNVTTVVMPAIDISSTDLRARVADGRPLDFLVPDQVLVLMRSEGLYPGLQEK